MAESENKKKIELYYDVISPYAWIGFEILCRYRCKWAIDLQFKPFDLVAVGKEAGSTSPAYQPRKAPYTGADLLRLAHMYKIPLKIPKDMINTMFVKGSSAAQLFLTAIKMKKPEFMEEVSRQLWLRVWSTDEDITEEASIKQAAAAAGMGAEDIEAVLQYSKQEEVKERYKGVSEEANKHKAFGAPTIIVEGQDGKSHLIWGSDRMEVIAMLIGEKYHGPLVELSKF